MRRTFVAWTLILAFVVVSPLNAQGLKPNYELASRWAQQKVFLVGVHVLLDRTLIAPGRIEALIEIDPGMLPKMKNEKWSTNDV